MAILRLRGALLPSSTTKWQTLGVDPTGSSAGFGRSLGMWNPNDNGLLYASMNDLAGGNGTFTPAAGVPNYVRCWVPYTCTTTNLLYCVSTLGTGAQLPVNVFIGLFNSAGTRLGVSASQDTVVQSTGNKTAALTVDNGQSLTVTGGPSVYVWVGFLIGTQSTTAVILRAGSTGVVPNLGLSAAPLRCCTVGSSLSALPTSFTPGTVSGTCMVVGAS